MRSLWRNELLEHGMDRRHRPRVTAKVMFYALLDVAGTLILASGLMWAA
ncbi:MAG: hypothetical protein AW12_00733 [Candidatus Accumulibacter sp. BA-94]|nr:MAG: hypothetical protein AW12_00733 [Candidatus Accumulibacter sp. BA-94]